MTPLHVIVLSLHLPAAASLLTGPAFLSKALGATGRPLIVHVWDPNPIELESFAIDDVSEACRKAGGAAVLCGIELVKPIAAEQEIHRGSFPGTLPVLADVALRELCKDGPGELCSLAKSSGASGIGIRYYAGDWQESETSLEDTLQLTVNTANEMGLGAILLPEFGANGDEGMEGAGSLASRVGAAAGLSKSPEQGEDGEKLAFGCWNGSPESLQRLRDDGFRGLLLKNACGGDVAWGSKIKQPSLAALELTRLIKASQSKGSKAIWGGAGSTGSGGGQSTAAYLSHDRNVAVPPELAAQMGTPSWKGGA